MKNLLTFVHNSQITIAIFSKIAIIAPNAIAFSLIFAITYKKLATDKASIEQYIQYVFIFRLH